MRLRRLDLDFFGHFTGHSYDFGPRRDGRSDFHIVHGSNEAGKTTTMEGYLRLLYGFRPKNDPYDFLHDRRTLKVSGLIDADGDERVYTRYANGLVDANGAPVPQAALDRMLAGLGQDDYRKLLCLDDDTIERGGQEILDSKGDIGRLLFAASAGIGDLTGVLEQGVEEARALYLKGSGKPRFAVLRKELDGITARIRETDVTAAAWRALRETLVAAEAEEAAADEARRALLTEAAGLEAMADVLPALDAVRTLRARLSAYDHYPERLDIDPEALVSMLTEQGRHAETHRRLTAEIAALRDTLAAITRDPERLTLAEALEGLEDLHGEYRAAAKHLPNRRASHDEAMRRMRRHADDLAVAAEADLSALALSPAQLVALDAARTRLNDARRDAERLAAQVAEDDAQAADAQETLDRLTAEDPGDAEIRARLDRFDAAAHAVAVQGLAAAEGRARESLAAISIKGRVFDTPPAVSLTAAEAADLIERLGASARARDDESRRRDDLIAADARAAARIDALAARAGIVSDGAVKRALDDRDALWTAHRDAPSAAGADAFEAAMRAVDAMASRRQDHAQDLGEMRLLEAERADHAIRLAQAGAVMARHEAALAETRARLDAAIAEAGIPLTATPGGLPAWLRALETARTEARAVEDAAAAAAGMLASAETLASDLARLLPEARPGDTLDDLLTAARARADAAARHASALDKARAARDTLHGTRTRRARALEEADTARADAESAWDALVADLTAGAVAPGILAASLDPLRALREADDKRLDMADRIAKMQAERSRFRDEIDALAAAHGMAASDDPLDTFAALTDAATHARKTEVRWHEASEALAAREDALAESERSLDRIARRIDDLGTAFDPSIPTGTLDALRDSVATAHSIIAERADLAAHERRIRTRLGVGDMDEARALLEGRTAERLASDRAALDTDLELAEDRYRAAIEGRRDAQGALQAVTGDADVARLVERRKTLELELQQVVLDYMELRLGNDLAEEAIRRYREENRHAMLTATESAFADLTDGAYTALRTQPDGRSETLLAIDATGASKAAAAMSKGTRFQLFLALRAAAYEQMAATGAVLPFFCDDVFETFDENRTRAACALMARIGRTGQALYLTHHRHVVDIARDICGDDVTVHTIG